MPVPQIRRPKLMCGPLVAIKDPREFLKWGISVREQRPTGYATQKKAHTTRPPFCSVYRHSLKRDGRVPSSAPPCGTPLQENNCPSTMDPQRSPPPKSAGRVPRTGLPSSAARTVTTDSWPGFCIELPDESKNGSVPLHGIGMRPAARMTSPSTHRVEPNTTRPPQIQSPQSSHDHC